MTTPTTFLATYQNGVLVPERPLPLGEGETFEVTLRESTPVENDAAIQRIRDANTLEELFAAIDAAPPEQEPEGYDFHQAMNANRAPGERILFPPETKGKSW